MPPSACDYLIAFIKAEQSIATFEKLDEYDTSERVYNSE
jgi:hypothetical protein